LMNVRNTMRSEKRGVVGFHISLVDSLTQMFDLRKWQMRLSIGVLILKQ
jgi:hypothetical protein